MVNRDQIIDSIIQTLDPGFLHQAQAQDDHANGVQILGSPKVNLVTLGVSLNLSFLKQASHLGSNFAIFHHGLDLSSYKSILPNYTQKRLRLIIDHQFTILGLHAALDLHPEIGNNAQIIARLGATITDTFFDNWGYIATFKTPITSIKLESKCQKLFGSNILTFMAGPKKIKTIAVCSGSAKPQPRHLAEMQAKGVAAFISGETSESTPHKLIESGINYLVCGHYATEVFGVKALGEKIKNKFGSKLKVEFIDVPNPI